VSVSQTVEGIQRTSRPLTGTAISAFGQLDHFGLLVEIQNGPAAPIKVAAEQLVKQRFLLSDDAARLVRAAEANGVLRAWGKE
jgi:hypothetical protein